MRVKTSFKVVMALIIIIAIVGILKTSSPQPETLRLATTTSTYDSGLLDQIIPKFEEKYNYQVQIISVGTGQAIANGEAGDVDIILVHAPASEMKFIEEGFGINRQCVMYNDFIIIGPESDPAEIKGTSVEDALFAIENEGVFISRGDNSGTHKKELKLWAEDTEFEDWYKETGQGMGATLQVANEMQAYTMTDRGTYISQKDNLDLIPLVEGDDDLLNPYGIIQVSADGVNKDGAELFAKWLMSEEAQKEIESFRKNEEALFKPLRGECIE